MDGQRPIHVAVILGTTRKGRMSESVAAFVHAELAKRKDVTTELIDIAALPMPVDDAGQAIRHPAFAESMDRADALVIVSPEYNHGFPGLLKHVLDSCLAEYVHKAVGVAGVSAGPFGGTRCIQSFLPVLRELGLVTIFWDLSFGNIAQAFDADGKPVDQAYYKRTDKFLGELIWMAKTLRHGRESIALE